jgi:acetoin:2,6-dichlorophenolindophenol oxidoreductase subunit beta
VVIDDSNRTCGMAGEVIATVSERVRLTAPPVRVTRPDGAVLPFSLALDRATQPNRGQLAAAIDLTVKER